MTNERGFTITEVLVAVMILSIGLLGLAGTAGVVTRMIGQGQRYTEASNYANERFEILRSTDCANLVDGSETKAGYTISWRITNVGTNGREMAVTVVSPTGRGTRTDTFHSVRFCAS